MPDSGQPIPKALSDQLSMLALEAKGLLSIMKAIRLDEKSGAFYKITTTRFKRAASELTHRYDTMSHFVPADALGAEAAKHGCKWDPSARKFVVNA